MAGGGGPRQRMINMMYLVLTAMLALQVSSSIMDKFIFLNSSLEHSLEASKAASEDALEALRKKVKKEGNSSEGKESIRRAEALKKETATLLGYIDGIKKHLTEKAGGGIHNGVIKNPKEETKVEVYMIGEKKSGKAYELKKKLDGFVNYLYDEYKDLGFDKPNDIEKGGHFPSLALGNKYNEIYKHDPIQRGKDFADANFGQTPVVAALAVLTQKETEVIRYEQEILKKLGAGDLSKDLKFDRILVRASAESNTVALGQDYEAEMFLSATSTKAKPRMTVNGSGITVDEGIGKVKIPASRPGENEWNGTVVFNNKGKDTTFTFSKKYTVVEPVLLVKAKANFPLYRNCANPLETAVPALGATYKPSFSVSNGSAVPGSRTGDVTIFPGAGTQSVLTVSSGGKVVGSAKFRVNPVPPPSIFLGNRNGKPINLGNPIPGAIPSLQIVAQADETFKNTLPSEANYRVVGLEVTQFRGGRSISQRRFNSGMIAMTQFQTRPGDGIQIKVISVQRVNSRGQIEQVKITNPYVAFTTK